MARTSSVYIRVEPKIKEEAEDILSQLGIPMSNAVNMFLKQVVLQRGIPFVMKLPSKEPVAMKNLTKEQFDKELEKGIRDIEEGRVFSIEDIETEMRHDYGI